MKKLRKETNKVEQTANHFINPKYFARFLFRSESNHEETKETRMQKINEEKIEFFLGKKRERCTRNLRKLKRDIAAHANHPNHESYEIYFHRKCL